MHMDIEWNKNDVIMKYSTRMIFTWHGSGLLLFLLLGILGLEFAVVMVVVVVIRQVGVSESPERQFVVHDVQQQVSVVATWKGWSVKAQVSAAPLGVERVYLPSSVQVK